MKQTTLVTRLALMLVMAGALVLAGCGGDDNGVRVETVEVPAEPIEVEVPDASGIEGVQQKAANAAAAAKMASDNAAAAVITAMDATANIATMQTGGMSGMMAYEAKKAADGAMKAYMDAKMASEAAAAATTTEAATEARVMAEAAQVNAEKYAMMATEKSEDAVKYAAMELMIVGKDKNVGESMLNAGTGMTTDTDDDGNKTITGRMMMDPVKEVGAEAGQAGAQDDPNTADTDEAKTPMVAVAARPVTLGRTLDTSDDMARLMLMTHYAGSKMAKVFDWAETVDATTRAMGMDAGKVTFNPDDDATRYHAPLTYKGMYYLATGTTPTDESESLVALDPTGEAPDLVNASDQVAPDAEPMRVYSYRNLGPLGLIGGDDDETRYVVLQTTSTTGSKTTYTYRQVDIDVRLFSAGGTTDSDPGAPSDTMKFTPATGAEVMAKIAEAKAYEHLHFGVWASLGDAKKDGSQEVDELGIGFVQNISGMGMTATMPNQGTATYNGDWAATIQEANEGAITLANGAAMLEANLDKMTLEADLMGLAVLTGDLTGSTFKGMKAAVMTGGPHGLNSSGTFTGTFEGGFYGDKAVEAGGIFDFTSTDIADGAFRGAFGGHRDDLN